jgi:hypothetical protein
MHVYGPNAPAPRPAPAVASRPAEPATKTAAASTGPTEDAPDAAAPTLWDLLTAEERTFFTQQAALGPLTYRRDGGAKETPTAPTGRRIDVRG